MKKYLLSIIIVLNLNILRSQEMQTIVKNFNNTILLNENFSQEDYEKIIYYNNFYKKGTLEYDNNFKWIKLSVSEIRNKIINKRNISICEYKNLPTELKRKIDLKVAKNYKILFLVEKNNSKTILITHYIFDENNKIVSFFNKLSKTKFLLLNPWYLNEKIDG